MVVRPLLYGGIPTPGIPDARRVARNLQWGAVLGTMGVWGQSPQLPEAQGTGAGAPSAQNFAFFCKNNLILEL